MRTVQSRNTRRTTLRIMFGLIPVRVTMACRMFAARLGNGGVMRAYKEARAIWRLEVPR